MEEYNEIQKLIIALDYIEENFFCEEESYENWVAKREEDTEQKCPFIVESDIPVLLKMLKKAIKQLEDKEINIIKEVD